MRKNSVKHALKAGETVCGSWIMADHHLNVRTMARSGFSYLCLDLEHAAIDWHSASMLWGMIADAGCAPLCRVPDGTMENVKRALDGGAWGIVAPMVDTVEQARAIVDACYYPPLGRRSVGGGSHYLSFGTSDAEYKARANEEICCILMCESPLGLANLPEIAKIPGVDAIFVGPNDFRSMMTRSLPGGRKPTVQEFEDAMAEVVAVGAKAGTPVGIHTFSPEECKARIAQGFRFMAMSSDIGILGAAAGSLVEQIGLPRQSTSSGAAGVVGGVAKY